jgi:Ser-tRNA(Ala) deacylase AlaX
MKILKLENRGKNNRRLYFTLVWKALFC